MLTPNEMKQILDYIRNHNVSTLHNSLYIQLTVRDDDEGELMHALRFTKTGEFEYDRARQSYTQTKKVMLEDLCQIIKHLPGEIQHISDKQFDNIRITMTE